MPTAANRLPPHVPRRTGLLTQVTRRIVVVTTAADGFRVDLDSRC